MATSRKRSGTIPPVGTPEYEAYLPNGSEVERWKAAQAKPKHRNRIEKKRRLSHMVRAISSGNAETIQRVREYHGDEVFEQAKNIWTKIDTRQIELRAECEATLVELIDESDKESVRLRAATDLLIAIDRANTLRSRFDDLKDPDTRMAAVNELSTPTLLTIEVIKQAWTRMPPGVAAMLEELGWSRQV